MVQKLEWTKQTVKTNIIKMPFNTLRSEFDEEAEEDFISSIRNIGVVEPVKLINVQECADPGLYLVDGRHRLSETERQQRPTIECMVANGSMDDVYDYNVLLNMLRGHTEPWQLAMLVDYLAQKNTLEEIAERWHMTAGYLSKLRSIVGNREVFEAWKNHKINTDQAYNIVSSGNNDDSAVNTMLKDIMLGKEKLNVNGDENSDDDDNSEDYGDDKGFVGTCNVCGNVIPRQQSTFLIVHKDCTNQFFSALALWKAEKKKSKSRDKTQ
jgi:uncharacterized ParB-like nuclease family protein